MIVVDTSVWVAALRNAASRDAVESPQAHDHEVPGGSLDSDFERMERVGLIALHRPAAH